MADEVTLDGAGNLVITTQQQAKPVPYSGGKLYNYTSGWLETQHKFSHSFGRWEMRAKLPNTTSRGIWPAFWLMPEPETSVPPNVCWPVGGEIDIMEQVGGDYNNSVLGTFHFAKQCGKDLYDGHDGRYPSLSGTPRIDWAADYHTFAVEWDSSSLKWFVDDVFYHQRNATDVPIPQTPFYVILNTAVAWYFPPMRNSTFPVEYVVDYVRVYDKSP